MDMTESRGQTLSTQQNKYIKLKNPWANEKEFAHPITQIKSRTLDFFSLVQ